MSQQNVHFSWVDCPNDDGQDLSMVSFSMDHKEGQPADLTITLFSHDLTNDRSFIGKKGQIKVGSDDQWIIFFTGHVTCARFDCTSTVTLTLRSCVDDQRDKDAIFDMLRSQPNWHSLIDDSSLESALGIAPLCPYWDRATGRLSTSHALHSVHDTVHLSDAINAETVTIQEKEPVSDIHITINAQWIQQWCQYQDIFPVIKEQFDDGHVSTYTESSLVKTWPKSGAIQHSGYKVVHSQLWEAPIPAFNKPMKTKNGRVIKKSYFDGQLIVSRVYKQKRKESVVFPVSCDGIQASTQSKDLVLNLGCVVPAASYAYDDFLSMHTYQKNDTVIYCGNVYQFVQDEKFVFFFDPKDWVCLKKESEKIKIGIRDSLFIDDDTEKMTDLGKQIVACALQRASTKLIWENRTTECRVRVPFYLFHTVTLDHVGHISMPHFSIKGKIVHLKMYWSWDEKWIDVTVKTLPEWAQKSLMMPQQTYYVDEGDYAIREGCAIPDPAFHMAHEMLCKPHNITIKNGPGDQEKMIHTWKNQKNDIQGTSIHVAFPKLVQKPCLENAIHLTLDKKIGKPDG